MLSRMEGLVGSVDLGVFGLFGEGHDLRGARMFRLLRVCLVTLAVAQLLPAFFGFLLAFLRLCVWLQLVSGFAQLPSFWSPVGWLSELSSLLGLEAQG